jgi:hypothetical protein
MADLAVSNLEAHFAGKPLLTPCNWLRWQGFIVKLGGHF